MINKKQKEDPLRPSGTSPSMGRKPSGQQRKFFSLPIEGEGRGGGLLYFCLLCLLCVSCQKDKEEPQEAKPIAFSAGVEVGTRAVGDGEWNTALLQAHSFGVYCWYTQDHNFDATQHAKESTVYIPMYNQQVSYASGKWNYTPSKYWPLTASDKLTFRAYAPYTADMAYDAKGMPLLPVTVASTDFHDGTQHDPLWGTGRVASTERYGALYNDYTYTMSGDELTQDDNDGTINWYFHHGMAKLLIRGVLSSESSSTVVKVTGISLTPFYKSGKLDISSPAGSAAQKPVWIDRADDTPDPMTVSLTETDLKPNVTLSKTEERNLLDDGKGLLVIPRDYDTSTPLTLTVNYTMDGVAATGTARLTQPLEGNTVYTIDLTLNPTTTAITVHISVNLNWQTGSHFSVNI